MKLIAIHVGYFIDVKYGYLHDSISPFFNFLWLSTYIPTVLGKLTNYQGLSYWSKVFVSCLSACWLKIALTGEKEVTQTLYHLRAGFPFELVVLRHYLTWNIYACVNENPHPTLGHGGDLKKSLFELVIMPPPLVNLP